MTCPKQSSIYSHEPLIHATKLALSTFILASCFNFAVAQDVIEEWKDFKDTSVQQAEQNLSSIVIFRPKDTINGPAVNIFIDGEYQSSLLPDAYTQASICAGVHHLSIAHTNILTRYKEKEVIGQKISPQKAKVSYFRIISLKDKSMKLEELHEVKAQEEIKKLTNRQNHTIPRVSKRICSKPANQIKH
jgi:hypothetical protein